ncbi:MAG TPA: hypothetical protein VKE97_08345 [Acidimicrobiia bacterium]|nr:hypothetical protein [Acidimicrobiia bacterium]
MPDSSSRLLVEAELRSLSRDLDAALGVLDLSGAVTRRLQQSTRRPVPHHARRRRLVVALVAAVAATATLAIPSARAAVTSFFEIGAVRVHEQPPPPGPVAGPLILGELTTLDGARARMPVVVPTARGFAAPDEVWFDAKTGGETSLVYRSKPGPPAAKHTDGVGLLVQEFVGDGTGFLNKYLGNGSRAERVAVGPYEGIFITGGDHFLAYDTANGEGATADGRLVGNALIFTRNGLTVRIEGDLPLARMVAIGAQLR